MEREIDQISEPLTKRQRKLNSDPYVWKKAWILCENAIDNNDAQSTTEYHVIVEKWIPLINKAFGDIIHLERYIPVFHYLRTSNNLHEIFFVFFETPNEENHVPMHIIFNVPLFLKIINNYYTKYKNDNRSLIDMDRGTVNLELDQIFRINPSEYFKKSTMWHLLFLSLCHMMAHVDTFEKYDTSSYSNHDRIKKSAFYKFSVHGQIKHEFI